MAPDGERLSRKTSSSPVSTALYPVATKKPIIPANKTAVPKQSRQTTSPMAPDGERTLMTKLLSSSTSTAIYSLATSKALKPVNKTVVPKQSRQISLEQKRRQTQQRQLQQIRAIRRKRTVAFAVNHERVSQPHTASVVIAEAAVAPYCCDLSSAQSESTRDTVGSEDITKSLLIDVGNSTVNRDSIPSRASPINRDSIPSRASPVIRDSTCTFQQNGLDFGKDYHVKDVKRRQQQQQMIAEPTHNRFIRESITDLPNSYQRFNANDETPITCVNREQLNNDNDYDHDTKEKRPIQSNNCSNRLVVNVRSAKAADVAISKKMVFATRSSSDVCHSAPVPVTPTSLSPCLHESNGATANTRMKRRRVGRPSKKLRSCSNQEQETSSSSSCSRCSAFAAKTTPKPKIKRVRYDMECVPSVEIRKDLLGDICRRFRKQSLSIKSSLPMQIQYDDNSNGSHAVNIDSKERGSSHSSATMLSRPNKENSIKNLAQSPSNSLLQGSVLWIPSSRQEWEDCLGELKAVCTSAAFRRWSKGIMNEHKNNISNNNCISNSNNRNTILPTNALGASPYSNTSPSSFQQPLSQAFIKDRVRIDDPLRGYQIRHAEGGWLQGFLVWTNFTVWTQDFQWNSNHPSSGLQHRGIEGRSVTDDDGTLSKELQALPRGAQDPLDGGVVLEQVAEISLLGGLGCGELLLQKAIEDIRKSKSNGHCNYKYAVLQATEGSRKFYEKMGFVRVGAVCRYRWAEYCTNKTGFTTFTTGTKPDLKKLDATGIDPNSNFDPPPTYHGYRHWTYTNESFKSLDAHGGSSVMMCLRLEDYDEENKQHQHQQTVSELLRPHLVHEKPVILLFGNVCNTDSENVTPTRKSKRRSTSCGSLRNIQQQQEQEHKKVSHHPSSIGVAGSGGRTDASAITRRTSNRSKRGRNEGLANSVYVLYGVEGGRNCSNKNVVNATTYSKNAIKRQRRSAKLTSKVATSETVNEAVVIPSTASDSDLGITNSHVIVKSTDVTSIDRTLALVHNNHNTKMDCPSDPTTTTIKLETKTVDFTTKGPVLAEMLNSVNKNYIDTTTAGLGLVETNRQQLRFARDISTPASPTVAPKRRGSPTVVHKREEQMDCSSLNDPTMDPSASKGGVTTAVRKIHEPIDGMNRNKSPSPPLIRKLGAKLLKQRVHHHVTRSSHPIIRTPTTIIPRKRSRQPAIAINKAKLFKQMVSRKASTTANFYNQVVVRRNVRGVLDQRRGRRIGKRRCGNDNPENGRIRLRYNGGIMMDHRYEFCYYFVLHHDELKDSLTIVPMIKDGVFERATGSKNNSSNTTVVDERVLGRPRYQCNILETDKNWIRDVSLEDYAIVPETVAVADTPLVAKEVWDIVGDGVVPYV